MKDWQIEEVTPEDFEGRENEVFLVKFPEGEVELVLENVKRHTPITPGVAGIPAWVRAKPFGLGFVGPTEPQLSHGTCSLEHPDLGRFDPVYLNCVAADGQQCFYNIEFG